MRETDRERKGKKYVNDIKVEYKKKKIDLIFSVVLKVTEKYVFLKG